MDFFVLFYGDKIHFPIVLYTAVQSEGTPLSHASDFDPRCFEAEFDIMGFAFVRQRSKLEG